MNNGPLDTVDVMTVVGARPQFIKSAAVTRGLERFGRTQYLVHTGQHPDDGMGLDFLIELGVPPPDARLRPSHQGRSRRMADMMVGITEEIERVRPKAVLVYGDTDSTLAGALAAHHSGVPLIHVEAGLRSGDRRMPEEHNRILTDQLSDLLCTTGPKASARLRAEGVDPSRIIEVGDVMLDLALAARELLRDRVPPGWPTGPEPVLVATLHRPATVDDRATLEGSMTALGQWCRRTGGRVYFPIHPRTLRNLRDFDVAIPEGVIDPGPLGYLDMQSALMRATGVLTDSGGVQKEAWYQGTAAVVLRDTTEWTELTDIGASSLYDPTLLRNFHSHSDLVEILMQSQEVPTVEATGLFGGGSAATSILKALDERL